MRSMSRCNDGRTHGKVEAKGEVDLDNISRIRVRWTRCRRVHERLKIDIISGVLTIIMTMQCYIPPGCSRPAVCR
jgi:hypothetical protein